jgi:hypothetical protein
MTKALISTPVTNFLFGKCEEKRKERERKSEKNKIFFTPGP